MRVLTGHAGDAEHVGIAGVEAVQLLRGQRGVQNQHLGGGVGAGAHPHPAGRLILMDQLLLPFLLILMDNTKSANSLDSN